MSDDSRQIRAFEKLKKRAETLLKDPQSALKVVDEASKKADREGRRLDSVKGDFTNLLSMLQAYFKGDYRKVPWTSIISALAAALYFINPFDVIPDFLLGVGMIDDATVIAFCLRSMKKDLDQFMQYKQAPETPSTQVNDL